MFSKKYFFLLSLVPLLSFSLSDEEKNLAPEEYQDMWVEAQNAIGISVEKRVPLWYMAADMKKRNPPVRALSLGAEEVYLNCERLDQGDYGKKRFTLLHEAAHVKCGHGTLASLSPALVPLVMPWFTKRWIRHPIPRLLLCVAGGYLGILAIKYKYESQADEIAAQSAKCSECLKAAIEGAHFSEEGYRQPEYFEAVKKRYEKAGLLCGTHAQLAGLSVRPLDILEAVEHVNGCDFSPDVVYALLKSFSRPTQQTPYQIPGSGNVYHEYAY